MMVPRIQEVGRHLQWCTILLTLLLAIFLLPLSHAYVGTAASYKAPYLPSACYGSDESEFPANRLFAAAGDVIWNNGAACGTQYLVTCVSAPSPSKCLPGIIQVTVVDRAATLKSHPSSSGAALVLSFDAFSQLVDPPTTKFINISFRQVS
ncbi:EG45-like domain containing protein [Silene latifolia]|uniref:EG45-like domain containing protein n=1 Tax=Silene latifolia TaxID=37657 RepID=UPI003D77A406